MNESVDTSICPLCQQKNICGAQSKSPCWCVSISVPSALINKVPVELKGKACICQICINKFEIEQIK